MWAQLRLLLGGRHRWIAALALSSVLSGLTEAGVLAAIAQIAANLVTGSARTPAAIGPFRIDVTVGALLAVAFVLAIFRIALQAPLSFLPARIAADLQAHLRKGLFAAFVGAPWSVQSRDRDGHLQEMMTSQVVQATFGALNAASMVSAVLTFLVLVVSALMLNVLAAAAVSVAAVLVFVLLRPLSAAGHRKSRELSQAQINYAGGVNEAIRVAEEVHVFGVADPQRIGIEHLVDTARQSFYSTQLLGRLIPNLYQSVIYVIIVAGLAVLYATSSGRLASLGAAVLLLVRAGSYGQLIQGSYQLVRQALPFAERVQNAQRHYATNRQVGGTQPFTKVDNLVFEDLSFGYEPSRPVLSHINFEVAGTEAIGIVGPSGAGKSSLVQVLVGLRPPLNGRYLINGTSVEQFAPKDWHSRVAYIAQEPRLLHTSVAENIRFFRELDDAAVTRAARLAGIHDDIVNWPHGYDTIVGPRADAVSGGQRQRISLARALAGRPQMLVLDEPTSALDAQSELLIRESLAALKGTLALFIVAHRLSTLDVCDRVMVIVDGRLQAIESVSALQSDNSYYRSASALAAVGQTNAP